MTVIEMHVMETIRRQLPEIAKQLERIADALQVKQNCCICGKPIIGYGHSAFPLNKDEGARCCDECNYKVVVERVKQIDKMFIEENNND